ncbi:MAG: sigma-70 family RNA polymerase sigma factor [Crocinitomicaceae bacterium]
MFIKNRYKYSSCSDEELLIRYKKKPSKDILGEYYIRYGHLCFGLALKYLKNQADAEDITMSVYEGLPQKLTNHSIYNFKSWLYSVVKNECLMRLRKKEYNSPGYKKELEYQDELENVQLLDGQLELLEQSIGELNDEQQTCIRLFYLEKKSYQEISALIQLEIKKVKSAIQNGKRNLKIKLEGHHEFKSTI